MPKIIVLTLLLLLGAGCAATPGERPSADRRAVIPPTQKKINPSEDQHPPQLLSNEWEAPIPLPGPINTAGAEDSPFVTPDGKEFYFFFTPDPNVPPERQLFDGVTGIWRSEKTESGWSEPGRVWLAPVGKEVLDGCEYVSGDTMWFCSARAGNFRDIDLYTAERKNGRWTNVKNAGEQINKTYEVGEMYLSADGSTLYFHSPRAGGKGKLDIWMTEKDGDDWKEPVNIEAVNTSEDEGWPALSADGSELWFLRTFQGAPAIFRSKRDGAGGWSKPELIVSTFAGEPSLDSQGNLYFTHHFFRDGKMLEADIYFAKRK